MPRKRNCGHGHVVPCTCAMGNLYRFVEPVVLLLLRKKGRSYGYDLGNEIQQHAFTDAPIERAALYRSLRTLEENGQVVSEWETDKGGPARRVYKLTRKGEEHLLEWAEVLDHVGQSMARFVSEARSQAKRQPAARSKPQ
jgi:PadR family transcriptional regulator, regulatory protein PadR